MDEISWFTNQPTAYRHSFLSYAYKWVRDTAPGDGFFSMPAQRVAFLFREDKSLRGYQYYAYDSKNHPEGFGDEDAIKKIWQSDTDRRLGIEEAKP